MVSSICIYTTVYVYPYGRGVWLWIACRKFRAAAGRSKMSASAVYLASKRNCPWRGVVGCLFFKEPALKFRIRWGNVRNSTKFNEGLPYFSTTCTLSGENYHLLQSKPTLSQGFLNRWADRVAIYRLQQSGGGRSKKNRKSTRKDEREGTSGGSARRTAECFNILKIEGSQISKNEKSIFTSSSS